MDQKRILGIDYGDVRTGLAISDPTGTLASGLGTLKAYSDERLLEEISPYITQYQPSEIVLGLPINMNGSRGDRAVKAEQFAEKLRERFSLEVILLDERCTTMLAHNILNTTDTRGKKRKGVVDTLSAEIILQNYLDSKKFKA